MAATASSWRRQACAWVQGAGLLALALVALLAGAQPGAQSAAADTPAFDVLEFEIEGNSVLPVTVVEAAVLPHLGPQRGMAGVEAARAALDQAYQKAGYLSVVVDIPEQRVDGGLVRLRVVEGRVQALRVTGAQHFSQGWIRDKLPALAPGNVPNFNEVQAQLQGLNRTDDRRVQPVLRAGTLPGTLEAELRVEDKLPLSGSLELNNRHAKDTVPWRTTATLRYANLFQREHSLSISATTAPENTRQARILSLNYSIPADDGGAWLAYLVVSDSLTEPLGASVIGKGNTFGLRRALALPALGGLNHGLTLGFDFKDLQQLTSAGGGSISSPLRYWPLVAEWSGGWSAARVSSQATLGLTLASRALGQRTVDCAGLPADQFECARRNGDGSFAVLRADLRQQWKLGAGGWQLASRLAGQLASGPLVSGEQYALGGIDTVRGYRESEASGEKALLASLELRAPNLASRGSLINDLTVLAFIDAARAESIDAAVGQPAGVSLASAGMGLKLRVADRTDGHLDLAWPLRLTPNTTERQPRLHARLALRF